MYLLERSFFFFFNDTATTEIYTLSLHDALPICEMLDHGERARPYSSALEQQLAKIDDVERTPSARLIAEMRSEEHTSELQSHLNLVCRLLLEKKKKKMNDSSHTKHNGTNSIARP